MARVTLAASSRASADAGAAMAARGGNAVDAAVAATLVSMCTDPGMVDASAGAYLAVWPLGGEPEVIDGFAAMPGRGTPGASRQVGGAEITMEYGGGATTRVGHDSVATPGAFAGLALASERHGRLAWAELFEPVLALAREGYPISQPGAEYLKYSGEPVFGRQAASRAALFHSSGERRARGELVQPPGLADSLAQLARDVGALYGGALGARVVAEVAEHGGRLTEVDLATYTAEVRAPERVQLGRWDVALNPPPAVGGVVLGEILRRLDADGHTPAKGPLDPAAVAQVARALKGGLELKDELLSSPSTTHTSAVDADGLACAITISSGYGSGVLVPGVGFWLNNMVGELELHPAGGLAPGERLCSNMAPAVARRDDGAVLAIGSPGASRITSATAQVLLHFAQRELPLAEAVAHSRLHVEPDYETPGRWVVACEPGLATERIELETRTFDARHMYFGGVQAALSEPGGAFTAAADERRSGAVASGGD
jgi:gamma-glutamyltranspeptidase/glutathione hydrolase